MPEIAAQFKKINRETLINHVEQYGSEDRKELRKWSKKQLSVCGYCGLWLLIYWIVKSLIIKKNDYEKIFSFC